MSSSKCSRSGAPNWGLVTMAILLLFSAALAAIAGFAVVVSCSGSVEAMLEFAQNNLRLALVGGGAFYLVLFVFSMAALERILGKLTKSR